jgi:F420-dependent oxidoreductase-like protein
LAFEGEHYQLPIAAGRGSGLGKPLKLMNHPVRERIPIYVAALGPRSVEATAELCEGWIPFHFWPERSGRVWGRSLRSGTSKRLPDLPPLEVVAGGSLAIGTDLESLRDRDRPALALYFGGMGAKGKNFYNEVLGRYGFEKEAERIQDLYLDGHRDEAAGLIPGSLLEGLSLIGDEGYVRDRVVAFREAGVTVLNVDPIGPNGLQDVETLASWLT